MIWRKWRNSSYWQKARHLWQTFSNWVLSNSLWEVFRYIISIVGSAIVTKYLLIKGSFSFPLFLKQYFLKGLVIFLSVFTLIYVITRLYRSFVDYVGHYFQHSIARGGLYINLIPGKKISEVQDQLYEQKFILYAFIKNVGKEFLTTNAMITDLQYQSKEGWKSLHPFPAKYKLQMGDFTSPIPKYPGDFHDTIEKLKIIPGGKSLKLEVARSFTGPMPMFRLPNDTDNKRDFKLEGNYRMCITIYGDHFPASPRFTIGPLFFVVSFSYHKNRAFTDVKIKRIFYDSGLLAWFDELGYA